MKNKIISDLKETHGIIIYKAASVTGGLLNLKWKISTNKGELLLKQYSTKRFKSRDRIEKIEEALQRQIILEKNGLACPFLWQYKDHVLRVLDNETIYMLMSFEKGKTERPDRITLKQMESLGNTCGLMHRMFSNIPAPEVKDLPTFGGYSMDLLWNNLKSRKEDCGENVNSEYINILLLIETILKQLDDNFFSKFQKGYAHEDFHSGNILFDENGVTSIVDFDRSCYSYVWHDIGRALLSFALADGKMNLDKVQAFINGYVKHLPLTFKNVEDALRLTWCIEVVWWIQPEFFEDSCSVIPKRFRDEILWIGERFFEPLLG